MVPGERRSDAITVLGAGSWGTALAVQFAREGLATTLWGRGRAQMEALRTSRRNEHYLPEAILPPSLSVATDLAQALADTRDLLVVVPSHAFRELLESLRAHLSGNARIAWATKGFEVESGKLPHQVAAEVLGEDRPTAVLSGPTFATEVGAGLPTALTIASKDGNFARSLAKRISGDSFRAYTSSDIIGVEVGGAVKNALAIGAGISDGLGFGANTRVALITRGLAEMSRLGVALGARRETFVGLAGIGDLVLTCTDDQSRNRRMGLALARGRSVEDTCREIGQVVEGVKAAKAIKRVAEREGVEMPISEQIYEALYNGKAPREAVQALMSRALKPENK